LFVILANVLLKEQEIEFCIEIDHLFS